MPFEVDYKNQGKHLRVTPLGKIERRPKDERNDLKLVALVLFIIALLFAVNELVRQPAPCDRVSGVQRTVCEEGL
jgi:hypothetical protein